MTLSQAHKATDKEIARMEKRIRAIYSKAGKEMQADAERVMGIFEKQDALKKAQVASGALKEEEYLAWRERAFTQGAHYTRLTEQLTQTALNADKVAIAYTNGQMAGIYALNFNAVNTTIGSVVKGYSFELVNPQMIKNLVKDNPNLLPLKKVNEKKVVRWAKSKINNELTQGIIKGESIPKIAKRLEKVTGMESKYAVTNARTMCTSAENKARLDGMEDAQEQGVVLEKEWSHSFAPRPRDWHQDMDGTRLEIDEAWETPYGEIQFPGDPDADPADVYNCRCTLITHIVGFKGKNGIVKV